MNSRERVLAAINHTEPEGLPVDLGATPSSGISAIAYDNLLRVLPLKDKRNWVYDVVQQVTQPSGELLDYLRIDTVDLGRTFNRRDQDWYDYSLSNAGTAQQPLWFRPRKQENGSYLAYVNDEPIAVMPATAFSYDQTVYPFLDGYPEQYGPNLDKAMGRIHWAALAHSPWDHASEPDFWEQLRTNALHLRETSDRAILLSAGCNLFEWGTFLRRLDYFIMDLKRAPVEVERFLDALMLRHLASLEKICEAVGDVVDIIAPGRRPGHEHRAADGTGNLPPPVQAAPYPAVRLHQDPQPHAHLPAFLRLDLQTDPRPDRSRLSRSSTRSRPAPARWNRSG